MPKSVEASIDNTRPQKDEELGTEVPISEESEINQLLRAKRNLPDEPTEVEEQQLESDYEQQDDTDNEDGTKEFLSTRLSTAGSIDHENTAMHNTENHYTVYDVAGSNQETTLGNQRHT